MAPIQRQRRRGLHTVHQISLQQFRRSVLRQSTVTDSIGQTVPDTRCSSSKGMVAIKAHRLWAWLGSGVVMAMNLR